MRSYIETLNKTLYMITSVTDIISPDGISSARFINHRQGMKAFTTARVNDYVGRPAYEGISRLGTELHRRVIDPFVLKTPMVQPYLIIVMTDGEVSFPNPL